MFHSTLLSCEENFYRLHGSEIINSFNSALYTPNDSRFLIQSLTHTFLFRRFFCSSPNLITKTDKIKTSLKLSLMSAISKKQAFAAIGAGVVGPSAPSASGAARKSVGLAYVCHGL
jgi:hypothetical protein